MRNVILFVIGLLAVHFLFVQGAKMGRWSTDSMGRIRLNGS